MSYYTPTSTPPYADVLVGHTGRSNMSFADGHVELAHYGDVGHGYIAPGVWDRSAALVKPHQLMHDPDTDASGK